MSEKLWNKVVSNYVKAGGVPFPINDTLIQIFQTLMTEEQAKFLRIFRKRSLNINQIKAKSELTIMRWISGSMN